MSRENLPRKKNGRRHRNNGFQKNDFIGSIMNKYENGVIKYQIQLEAYKNGQANEIIALLDKANSEIVKFIKKTDGVYTKKRYLEIARKLKDVAAALKENVGNNIDLDGLIEYELKKQKSLLDSVKGDIIKVKGGTLNFLYPTLEQIKTAAMFKPVTDGFTYDSYLNGIETGLYNTWDSAVRTGYLTGQPTKQIVSKVLGGISPETKLRNPGLMNTLRNSIYGNTRTVLQSFAEETRERVYQENERYFGDGEYKYERIATLDARTCLVCANLDGKLYKTLKEAQPVILHRGDRCLLLPYFNIEGETRASKDGYVSSKVTYSDWLGKQDEKTQLDVLGRTRFELYRRGKNISQFIDSGNVLTLEQLKEKIDIKAILSKNIHEPDKENLSGHVVNERFMERGVTLDDVIDAIDNPLKRYPVRVSDGAYRIVGKKATIGVSAFDGKITTVWKTSDKKVEKLMEMLRDEDSE